MILRATEIYAKVWDVWKGLVQSPQDQHTAASIQICGSFNWSTFQLAIHRSTAKAMFGILQRMYDFVMQQKKRSERTIGLMLPAGTAASTAFAAYQEEQKRAEKSRAAEIGTALIMMTVRLYYCICNRESIIGTSSLGVGGSCW